MQPLKQIKHFFSVSVVAACITLVNSPLATVINMFDSEHRLSDSESQRVFVVAMTGCSKNPAVSSWEETQLERLTPDTAAVQIVE